MAPPDVNHWVPGLPKARSENIMRRTVRKIAEGDVDSPAIRRRWRIRGWWTSLWRSD